MTDTPPPVVHHRTEYVEGLRDPRVDIFVANRPWGSFTQFVSNETVTVKTILVEAGHRLSLQRHEHRGEMWTMLDVPIDVTVDERTWTAAVGSPPTRAATTGVPHASDSIATRPNDSL